MLNKRTNILLEEQTFNYLVALANKKGASVGEIIRRAIEKVYLSKQHRALQKKQWAFKKILKLQDEIKTSKKTDYKKLIEYGRRF